MSKKTKKLKNIIMPATSTQVKYKEINLKGVSLEGVLKCGCCQKEWPRFHFTYDKYQKHGLNSACKYCQTVRLSKSRTSKKDKSVFITLEEFHSLLDMNCVWCGSKGGSVDRWHSDLNYIRANVVPACALCNKVKRDCTVKEFITYNKRINPDYKPLVEYDEDYDLVNPPLGIDI
jgi:hypothetical protein